MIKQKRPCILFVAVGFMVIIMSIQSDCYWISVAVEKKKVEFSQYLSQYSEDSCSLPASLQKIYESLWNTSEINKHSFAQCHS